MKTILKVFFSLVVIISASFFYLNYKYEVPRCLGEAKVNGLENISIQLCRGVHFKQWTDYRINIIQGNSKLVDCFLLSSDSYHFIKDFEYNSYNGIIYISFKDSNKVLFFYDLKSEIGSYLERIERESGDSINESRDSLWKVLKNKYPELEKNW